MKANIQGNPPWGKWLVLDEGPNFKVKRIEVDPGKRLSYQRHRQRAERWIIVQGEGKVTLEDQIMTVKEWNDVQIPAESAHRIENSGSSPLIFIEVQRGKYLEEADIIRIEDDYGRLG